MKFCDMARSLCLETDASGIGMGAKLLQIRDGMNCGCDKMPDNARLPQLHLLARAYLVHRMQGSWNSTWA